MTADEFKRGYCERSKMTAEEFDRFYVVLPCACGEERCQGWAAVYNNPQSIKHHMEFDAPTDPGNEPADRP